MTIASLARPEWTEVATGPNCAYYVAHAPDVLIIVPTPGAIDDEHSARENMKLQLEYFESLGTRGAHLILMGRLARQTAGARRLYAKGATANRIFATALVVTSPLSRAIASFFTGLTRPAWPVKTFDAFEPAMRWLDEVRPK